jgi:hypothetical protein
MTASGGHPQRWMASTGRILGALGFLVFLGGFAFLTANSLTRDAALLNSGRATSVAFIAYAADNDDLLPIGDDWLAIEKYATEEIPHLPDFLPEFPGSFNLTKSGRASTISLGIYPGKLAGDQKQNVVVSGDGRAYWEKAEATKERNDRFATSVSAEILERHVWKRWQLTAPMEDHKYTEVFDFSNRGMYFDKRIYDYGKYGRMVSTEYGKLLVRPDGLLELYRSVDRKQQIFMNGKEVLDKKLIAEAFEGEEQRFKIATQIPVSDITEKSMTIQTLDQAGSGAKAWITFKAMN